MLSWGSRSSVWRRAGMNVFASFRLSTSVRLRCVIRAMLSREREGIRKRARRRVGRCERGFSDSFNVSTIVRVLPAVPTSDSESVSVSVSARG